MTEFIDSKQIKNLNKELDKIGKGLFKSAAKFPDAVTQELVIGANDIRNDIIKSMARGEKTGIVYTRKGGKTHRASAPGESPAVDSGELIRSIIFDTKKLEIEVGAAGAPHAEPLEFGAKYKSGRVMEPRPFLAPAVDNNKDEIIRNVGKAGVLEIIKPLDETL